MDWYPWDPVKFKAATMHLDDMQELYYRRMIDYYMITRSPLPHNEIALAKICGCSVECYKHASSMLEAFFEHANGMLMHDYCDKILDEQDIKTRFRTERAKKAALKRWKNKDKKQEVNATSMLVAMLGDARVESKSNNIYMSDFDEFWELYPKQRAGSKKKAMSSYKSALGRATKEQIIQGLKSYVVSDEVAKGFAKGAAAWLNDDRWLSEYTPAKGNKVLISEYDKKLKQEQEEARRAGLL